MANKTINDFAKVTPPLDTDSMIFQKGLTPSGATDSATLGQILAGMLTGTIVPVFSESNLPTPSGGNIALEGKHYMLLGSVSVADTLLFTENTSMEDFSKGKNTITSTAGNIFSFQNATGISARLDDLTIIGDGANTLFTGVPTSAEYFLVFSLCNIVNIDALGTLDKVLLSFTQSRMADFTSGLTIQNVASTTINGSSLLANVTADNVDILTFASSAGLITVGGTDFLTKSNGNAFNIDSGVTGQINIASNTYIGNSVLFKAGGLDHEAPNARVLGNGAFRESTVAGIMAMSGNAVETTIVTQNTYTAIAGTTTAGADNERIDHATGPNRLTYVGFEPITANIHLATTALIPSGNILFDFAIFKNGSLVADAVTRNELSNRAQFLGLNFLVVAVTDDEFEIRTQNVEGTTNITFTNFVVTITN